MSTYLRRRGRLTRAQGRALETHSAQAVIRDLEAGPLNWTERFGRDAPLGLEIGFGMGQALLDWAEGNPEMNLLGLEVYQPGIGSVLHGRAARALEHLLIIDGDANVAVESLFAPGDLSEVRIFFPDPWPKKRHHKRRLVQPAFVSLLSSRLAQGGRLRLATDWEPYAHWMLEVLEGEETLENLAGSGFAERFAGRNVTRFEARGQRLGHEVWDLSYRRR